MIKYNTRENRIRLTRRTTVNMKNFFAFIGAIVFIAALVFVGIFLYNKYAKTDDGEFEIVYSYEKMLESSSISNEKQMYVKEYKGKSPESIVIPEKANDQNGTERKVTGIRAKAFANNKNLKTIEIPSGIIYFEGYIFKGCDNLETIILKTDDIISLSSFGTAFEGIDISKVMFVVESEAVRETLLRNYPEANIQMK